MGAIRALGLLGAVEELPRILKAGKDDRVIVREAVCGTLGRLGRKEGISFISGFLKDKDKWNRVRAVEALAGIRDPESGILFDRAGGTGG